MADLVYVAVVIVFFALAALYVVACERLIGPDPDHLTAHGGDLDPVEDAGADEEASRGARAAGVGAR
jgi:hypothetical protein